MRRIALAVVTLAVGALPAVAQKNAPPAVAPAAAPAADRGRSSWTTDRVGHQVGDIITVLLSESTLASAEKSQDGTDEQSRDLGVDAGGGVGDTKIPAVDVKVGTDRKASSRQRGDARRDVRFVASMSVQVVNVSPAGLLEIKGTREVDVDKSTQQFSLSGWVRPEDVSPRNTLDSSRIANAKISYRMKGNLGRTRGGIVGRLLGVFWP